MSWLTASAIAISLIPGVASWLSGIRLIRLRDDPALPERLQARSVLIGRVTAVAMVPAILLPGSFSWKLLLIVSSLILGDFNTPASLMRLTGRPAAAIHSYVKDRKSVV